MGKGVAVLLRALAVLWCLPALAFGQSMPARAYMYVPLLVEHQKNIWPDAPIPSFLAAQIEQESCITVTHPKCWNPTVQYKTSREWGRGLGQTTTAYRADGSIRFDKQAELRNRFPSLSGWTAANWADPNYQLIAVVESDRWAYDRIRNAATTVDRLAFTLSGYNGGEVGVLRDRALCANTVGCDPAKWFGHVELNSIKSKLPQPGYKTSFYSINREYVLNILVLRRPKYQIFFNESAR